MYEMEGALLDLPIQAGRFAWQRRLRRADRRGQPPASGSGFPAPSASREFPLGRCPFPTWMYFYSSVLAPRKRPGGATEIFFAIHRITVVIHASARLSTALFTAYPQVIAQCRIGWASGAQRGSRPNHPAASGRPAPRGTAPRSRTAIHRQPGGVADGNGSNHAERPLRRSPAGHRPRPRRRPARQAPLGPAASTQAWAGRDRAGRAASPAARDDKLLRRLAGPEPGDELRDSIRHLLLGRVNQDSARVLLAE